MITLQLLRHSAPGVTEIRTASAREETYDLEQQENPCSEMPPLEQRTWMFTSDAAP